MKWAAGRASCVQNCVETIDPPSPSRHAAVQAPTAPFSSKRQTRKPSLWWTMSSLGLADGLPIQGAAVLE